MSPAKLYGIPNCDTVKKAILWLNNNNIPFVLHDYKKEGISGEKLREWCKHLGAENVFNRKSTTWQKLSDKEKNAITNEDAAIELMMRETSIIKRPVLEVKKKYLIGFKEEEYSQHLL